MESSSNSTAVARFDALPSGSTRVVKKTGTKLRWISTECTGTKPPTDNPSRFQPIYEEYVEWASNRANVKTHHM